LKLPVRLSHVIVRRSSALRQRWLRHYIIVNLPDNVIESYMAPISGDDARFGRHETLTSGRLDIGPVSVDVAELLGLRRSLVGRRADLGRVSTHP
jgi:hypothetical protein